MKKKTYWRGSTPRIWDDSFKDLDFDYVYPESHQRMIKQWHDQGYPPGLTYNGEICFLRTAIPDYMLPLCKHLAWNDIGCQIFRMKQADILPVHQDHYFGYKKRISLNADNDIWRAVVFLEDWKSGHYFELNGEPWVQWHAGDYAVWSNDVPHMAGNIGIEPRYTLQLTGWL